MFLKAFLLCAAVLIFGAFSQFNDYSSLQDNVNTVVSQADRYLHTFRSDVSDLVLSTTDEMIAYATDSLNEGGNDPKAPMISACTLFPTNYLNHYTKELNTKLADAQAQVNSMKFVVLKSLMNQPMVSESDETFAKVQEQVLELTSSWTAIKLSVEQEIAAFKDKVTQLVLDMKECIAIADE